MTLYFDKKSISLAGFNTIWYWVLGHHVGLGSYVNPKHADSEECV